MYLGIDLGTTHSSVGVCEGPGEPTRAATLDEERIEPFHTVLRSMVWTPQVGRAVVGYAAEGSYRKSLGGKGPTGRFLQSFKPLLSKQRLARDIEVWEKVDERFSQHSLQREPVLKRVRRRVYGRWSREDVTTATAQLIEALATRLRKSEGIRFEDASRLVFGIPMIAGSTHQRRVLAALARTTFGRSRGPTALLEVVRFVPEPVAAAWFAGMQPHTLAFADETVAVCDAGGGTTDLALIRYVPSLDGRALIPRLELGLGGLPFAGDRLTDRLEELVLRQPGAQDEWDAFDDDQRMTARLGIEEAKRDLSEKERITVQLDPGRRGYPIGRKQFEAAIKEELDALGRAVQAMVARAGVRPRDVHRMFLVGGSSLVPRLQSVLRESFPLVGPAHERSFDARDRQEQERAITSISAGLAAYGALQDQQRRASANYFLLGAADDEARPGVSVELGTDLSAETPTCGRWTNVPIHEDANGKRCLSVGLYHDLMKPTFLFGVCEWPSPGGFGGAHTAKVRVVFHPHQSVPDLEVADRRGRVLERFSLSRLIAEDPDFLEHDREMWQRDDHKKAVRRPLTKLIEENDVLEELGRSGWQYQVVRVRPLGAKDPAPMTSFSTSEYSFLCHPTKRGVIDATMIGENHGPAFGKFVHPGDES